MLVCGGFLRRQLRLLYFKLLQTPLESSDLSWERLKGLVAKGSRSSTKSRRGPRADGNQADRGAPTYVEVYDLLGDELLPQLLQQLQQQKSATLEELQLQPDIAAAEEGANTPQDATGKRAVIKARGRLRMRLLLLLLLLPLLLLLLM